MDEQARRIQAYRALYHASEQVGAHNYATGRYRAVIRRGKVVRGYTLTEVHVELTEAMPAVLSGEMSVEEAMALVTAPRVMKERFGD